MDLHINWSIFFCVAVAAPQLHHCSWHSFQFCQFLIDSRGLSAAALILLFDLPCKYGAGMRIPLPQFNNSRRVQIFYFMAILEFRFKWHEAWLCITEKNIHEGRKRINGIFISASREPKSAVSYTNLHSPTLKRTRYRAISHAASFLLFTQHFYGALLSFSS